MSEDLEQIGLETVDRFITTWNSRDPVAWAGSLNFPHVRPTHAGEIFVFPDADDYAAKVDFQKVIASGWDHSEWDYKQVLHTSPSKIHVAGQWSRFSAAGEKILTTPIVYICTKVDGQWGIQSRFAADYVDEDGDITDFLSSGLELVQKYVEQTNTSHIEACRKMISYPHYAINVGGISITEGPADLGLPGTSMQIESLFGIQTGEHCINIAVELSLENGERRQAAIYVNDRNGKPGIQAWSILNPDES